MNTKQLFTLVGIATLLGILHNILFFDDGFGINFLLFAAALLFGGCVLTRHERANASKTTMVLMTLVVFFSSMVFIRASLLLSFFNVIGTGLLFLVLVGSHGRKKLASYIPGDYAKVLVLPFAFVPACTEVLSKVFAARKNGRSLISKEIVRGSIMAVIAVMLFAALFASADQIFGNVIVSLFSFNIDGTLIARPVVFGLVTAFLMGAFGYVLKGNPSEDSVAPSERPKMFGPTEIAIVMTSISSLFFVFILFQITYLFGGETLVMSQGLTYAEYARKGFFELLTVALLTYAIISCIEGQIAKRSGVHFQSFKVLSSILIVEVVIILVSAFYRLSLYEAAYGFTTIRLYSHALMVWLSVIFFFLAGHIVTNGSKANFGMQVFFATVLLLLSMNLINPDAFIARKNIERYQETGKLDVQYVARLSDDAVPVLMPLLNGAQNETQRSLMEELYSSLEYREPRTWKSIRLSEIRAAKLLAPYANVMREAADEARQVRIELNSPQVELDFPTDNLIR
jgi:hypothetical protein